MSSVVLTYCVLFEVPEMFKMLSRMQLLDGSLFHATTPVITTIKHMTEMTYQQLVDWIEGACAHGCT